MTFVNWIYPFLYFYLRYFSSLSDNYWLHSKHTFI